MLSIDLLPSIAPQTEPIAFGKARVRCGDDALAGIEPFEHFDMVGVAAAELDLALDRDAAVRIDDEYPVAAGLVVEGAVGKQQGRRRIAERQPDLDGLAALQ